MGRALLDSDVIIWHLRGRENTRRWIAQLSSQGVPCCSSLSVTEIVIGMRPKEAAGTRALFNSLHVIPVDRRIAWRTGEIIRANARRGITLDFVDATIAATCLIYGLTLATYNLKHYPLPELEKAIPPAE